MSVKKTFLLLLAVTSTMAHADALADVLIDPTRPAYAPVRSTSSTVRSSDPVARVTAIFQKGDSRVAVLDGQLVKAGDRVGDVVIQEIMVDGVRLMRAGRIETVRIPKQAAVVRSVQKDADRRASIREESNP